MHAKIRLSLEPTGDPGRPVRVAMRTVANGCEHYRRGCKLVASCCNSVVWCRVCHDETAAGCGATMDRKAVAAVVCADCGERQPPREACAACGNSFGRYACLECRLYDDDAKGQFHCAACGICRRGGRDNFFHCERCGMCLSVHMRGNHACRPDRFHDACPVCLEPLFESRREMMVLKCGHPIHHACVTGMLENGMHKCPMCGESMVGVLARQEEAPAPQEVVVPVVAIVNDHRAHWLLPLIATKVVALFAVALVLWMLLVFM